MFEALLAAEPNVPEGRRRALCLVEREGHQPVQHHHPREPAPLPLSPLEKGRDRLRPLMAQERRLLLSPGTCLGSGLASARFLAEPALSPLKALLFTPRPAYGLIEPREQALSLLAAFARIGGFCNSCALRGQYDWSLRRPGLLQVALSGKPPCKEQMARRRRRTERCWVRLGSRAWQLQGCIRFFW